MTILNTPNSNEDEITQKLEKALFRNIHLTYIYSLLEEKLGQQLKL